MESIDRDRTHMTSLTEPVLLTELTMLTTWDGALPFVYLCSLPRIVARLG